MHHSNIYISVGKLAVERTASTQFDFKAQKFLLNSFKIGPPGTLIEDLCNALE
jgi:hypothetical protein